MEIGSLPLPPSFERPAAANRVTATRRNQEAERSLSSGREVTEPPLSHRAERARLAVRDSVQNQLNLQPDTDNRSRAAIESYLRVQLDTDENPVGELVGLNVVV